MFWRSLNVIIKSRMSEMKMNITTKEILRNMKEHENMQTKSNHM